MRKEKACVENDIHPQFANEKKNAKLLTARLSNDELAKSSTVIVCQQGSVDKGKSGSFVVWMCSFIFHSNPMVLIMRLS